MSTTTRESREARKASRSARRCFTQKGGVRKHLLDDLYVRFFRLAEIRIGEKAEFGVVSFISNSSYLVGRSHPIMRESLLSKFDAIWIDNLHGNRIASERTPWGDSCQTIFNTEEIGPGIKVGTCVSTLLKKNGPRSSPAKLFIRDFWGRAEQKRDALLASLGMDSWPAAEAKAAGDRPEGPRTYSDFVPSKANGWKFAPPSQSGFEDWPALDDLFPKSFQGVNPNRGLDGSVIGPERSVLESRMRDYFSDLSFGELKKRHPVLCQERARYEPKKVRDRLRKAEGFEKKRLLPSASSCRKVQDRQRTDTAAPGTTRCEFDRQHCLLISPNLFELLGRDYGREPTSGSDDTVNPKRCKVDLECVSESIVRQHRTSHARTLKSGSAEVGADGPRII